MEEACKILRDWTLPVEACGDLLEMVLNIEPYSPFLENCDIPVDAVVLGVRIPRVQ
tara:strand:+ start:212 stop:379 length:168 start_codon:yes stop_codon:yes gene_type:complete